MQKKPGQISANTLSLRFMQNAARVKEEKELEAAKAKVRSEEEWELPQSVKEVWGISERESEVQGTVTYEQSYLPFLFPGLSSAGFAPIASTSTSTNADSNGHIPRIQMRGRRVFGKQGKEEISETAPPDPATSPQPPSPSSQKGTLDLPRGSRGLSHHGRLTDLSSQTSASKSIPTPLTQPSNQVSIDSKPSTQGMMSEFLKPQIESPRAKNGTRRKRTAVDGGGAELGDDRRKIKKRKDKV